jgi:hypothetical protein
MRPWLFRVSALMLVTLCLVAWVGSYCREVGLERWDAPTSWVLTVNGGDLELCTKTVPDPAWRQYVVKSWDWIYCLPAKSEYSTVGSNYNCLGFYAWFGSGGGIFGGSVMTIVIPIWFPSLLAVGLLWFVWRKTRAKPDRKAFPVEGPSKSLNR